MLSTLILISVITGVYEVGTLKEAQSDDGLRGTHWLKVQNTLNIVGRLVVHFKINQGRVSTKYFLERDYALFSVVEIKESKFEGDEFQGYESVELPFPALERIINSQKHRGNLHLVP